ncbi:PH domain-containing protein [Mucilaginibacter sp. AW1-7]|jgi:membrane protein YdbS with pleckstrin-like domain|uniref:PH domain-containing protein n=1 Tax=Mucilaginibacter sp. AW1-7 TaxID=3349874 RepID=UPI003F737F2E
MEIPVTKIQEMVIKPAPVFAFLKTLPLILLSLILLYIAWLIFPAFILMSLITMLFACYRFRYIRKTLYIIEPQLIRIQRGIFFKRTDIVEMYRVKDYIITQPFILQLFQLMNLTLKTTDAENPVIWLRGIPRSDLTDVIRNHVQEARKANRIFEIN